MNIKCKVTISRRSDGLITIEVLDEASRARFLDLEMTLEAFAQAITGLSFQEADGEVRGLEVVGKTRIDEPRQAIYPGGAHDAREVMEAWLMTDCQEPGWRVDNYLGAQRSVTRDAEGRTVLHYRVTRFE